MTRGPFWLDPRNPLAFPPVELAMREPDGLLALGGDLSPERLLTAYHLGIFPWYSEGQPILWWSPDPRLVLELDRLHISRSLRKTLRQAPFRVSIDEDFSTVIEACGAPRREGGGTWLTREMIEAYEALHRLGHAHSVECWQGDALVGGLYGVSVGRVFFGESMFSAVSNASKIALVHLVHHLQAWDFRLLDCQIDSEHLRRLGAQTMPRARFIPLLHRHCDQPHRVGRWEADPEICATLAATGGAA
jgi:leucyl/phenylalanyl-tRNA--protein transferase